LEDSNNDLRGRRVLVVEDESLISMLIEDALSDLGCKLACQASSLVEALEMVSNCQFDIAILDVNLNGEETFPVAEALIRRGIPFIFATGYGATALPGPMRTIPVLLKPFQQAEMEVALRAAFASPPNTRE
jgi:CheY-like chemotaxis protein